MVDGAPTGNGRTKLAGMPGTNMGRLPHAVGDGDRERLTAGEWSRGGAGGGVFCGINGVLLADLDIFSGDAIVSGRRFGVDVAAGNIAGVASFLLKSKYELFVAFRMKSTE